MRKKNESSLIFVKFNVKVSFFRYNDEQTVGNRVNAFNGSAALRINGNTRDKS